MKKILITRRLLRSCEDKAKETFEANFNLNDELYSQKKLIELSAGQDGILSSLTDKLDEDTINNGVKHRIRSICYIYIINTAFYSIILRY